MPRLENIERFKEILHALGSEPEITAQQSEAPAPRTESEPEGGAEIDFGLDSSGDLDLGGDEPEAGEDLPGLSLDDLLGEGHEGGIPPAGEDMEPPAEGEEPGDEGLSFDGVAGGGEGADGLDGLDVASLLGEETREEIGEEPAAGEPAAEEPDIGEPVPEESAPEEPAPKDESRGGTEGEADGGDLGLANGFFMPDLGLESGEAEAESAPVEDQGEAAVGVPPGEETVGAEAEPFDPFAVDFGPPATEEAVAEEPSVPAEDTEGGSPSEETFPAPEAREESLDLGSFDTAGFDTELPARLEGPSEGGSAELGDTIDELAEGFSLEGLAEGVEEGAQGAEAPAVEEKEQAPAPEAEEPPSEEISLEDREFRAIQRNLAALPRNLKIAIESLIGEQGYAGEGLRPLLDMLARGASPQDMAAHVGKVTGRTIRIPARFEKQTGEAFEEEQRSAAYIFRRNVLPILRTIVLVGGLLGILAFGAYRYVYKPLYAQSLYRTGYRALEQERYGDSERSFAKAIEVRQVKSWYYRYADGYAERKQYTRADQMYQRLEDVFGYDKKELLDRARLQSRALGRYSVAEELLHRITDKSYHDYDANLALGDNYLDWAKRAPAEAAAEGEHTSAELLESARRTFAHLLERYGYKNDLLFRMMRYFVRSDLLADVQDLRDYLEGDPDFKPDAETYAEVGGYLLDKGDVEGAETVLLKANAVSTDIPEIDYHLARLYRAIDDPGEEGKALKNTLVTLEEVETSPERLSMEVDAHRRYGEWFYRGEQYLDAESEFGAAIALMEDARNDEILVRRPELGLAYEGLGNIRYYVDGEYPAALDLYTKAERAGVDDPKLAYRIGYVHFAQGDYERAVKRLVEVQEKLPQNWNVLYGLGTALVQRGDYFAAEGYYRHLLERLTDKRNGIRDLKPDVNPDHYMLVNLLTKAHNNLGVTYYMQARIRGFRGGTLTRALVEVSQAGEYLDLLARDPETLARSEAKNLAYLNANAIQHPTSGFVPTIYDKIPKDTEIDRF